MVEVCMRLAELSGAMFVQGSRKCIGLCMTAWFMTSDVFQFGTVFRSKVRHDAWTCYGAQHENNLTTAYTCSLDIVRRSPSSLMESLDAAVCCAKPRSC